MSGAHILGWHVARRSDLVWRRTASQVLVLEPGTGRLVVLEGAGIDLWELLSSRHDVSDVILALAERHGANTAVVASEVLRALSDLSARGLLEASAR